MKKTSFVALFGMVSAILVQPDIALAQVNVETQVFASALPEQRTIKPGQTASWFATIINSSDTDIHNCKASMRLTTPMFLSYPNASEFPFHFQTTDPATNALVGSRDTVFDILAGGSQTLVFFVDADPITDDPQGFPVLDHTENVRVPVDYTCDEGRVLPTSINQPRLTVSSETLPDIIPIAIDLDGSGQVKFSQSPFTAVAVAAILANPGDGPFANIVVTANDDLWRQYDHMDTFHAVSELPNLRALICETNPSDGTCLVDPTVQVTTTFGNGAKTFSVFYELAQNTVLPNLPLLNRTVVDFGVAETDAEMARRFGSTSLAISGVPASDVNNDPAWDTTNGFGATFDQVRFAGAKSCEPELGGNASPCKTDLYLDLSDDSQHMLFTYDEHTHGCDDGSNICEESTRAFWGELDCVDDAAGTEFLPQGNWWEEPLLCEMKNTQVSLDANGAGDPTCTLDGTWNLPANPERDWSQIPAPDWGDATGTCGGSTHHVGGEQMVAVDQFDGDPEPEPDPDVVAAQKAFDQVAKDHVGTWSAEILDPDTGKTRRGTFEIVRIGNTLRIRFLRTNGQVAGESDIEYFPARGDGIPLGALAGVSASDFEPALLRFNVVIASENDQFFANGTYRGFLAHAKRLNMETPGSTAKPVYSTYTGNMVIKRISTTTSQSGG
jgi:hypothetical protein